MLAIATAVALVACVMPASPDWYEGEGWPEEVGWTRQGSFTAERELRDGWFIQHIEGWYDPPVMNGGDHDSYLGDMSDYEGTPFFVEWRAISDAPSEEVDHHNGGALMVLVGGPVTYHFNMASGLARLIRGYQFEELYFIIEPDIPHTYRLNVYGGEWFEFRIDGALVAADVPEDVFPTPDTLMSFGARYHLSGHTTQWDYVHFGVIPEPATGVLVLLGAAVLVARRVRSR